ncbi:hypothetical protein B0H13DRAFT_2309593 [Mycena leptocephala]|nr:hypothetical protein B0H13DRAFT_2309593 [Mycena leptocephala]
MRERSILWNVFHDDKTRYKSDHHHYNAWCLDCLDPVIARVKEAEILATANGAVPAPPKTDKEWRTYASTKVNPMCGKLEIMRKHLMKCAIINSSAERQQQRTTLLAQVDAAKNPSSRSQPSASSSRSFTEMPPPPPHQSTSFSQFSPSPQYNSYHSPSPSSVPPLSPLFPFEGLQSFPPGSPFSPPNDLESPSLFEYSHKRRRTSTTSSHFPTWSGEQQQEFNEDLCKLFATCGWSWNAVNSPELKLFFGKYLPRLSCPTGASYRVQYWREKQQRPSSNKTKKPKLRTPTSQSSDTVIVIESTPPSSKKHTSQPRRPRQASPASSKAAETEVVEPDNQDEVGVWNDGSEVSDDDFDEKKELERGTSDIEDEDSDGEPPAKRQKHKSKENKPESEPVEITVNISFYSPKEFKKDVKKLNSIASGIMTFDSDDSYRKFEGKLLAKAQFSVPRHVKNFVELFDDDDYKTMPAAPVINNTFTIPDALLETDPSFQITVPAAASPPPVTQPLHEQVMILPSNTKVGDPITIAEFCLRYDLDESIATKLGANGYRKAAAFKFMQLKDLVPMGFLPGDIAELRDAIQQWVVP